MFYEKKRFTLYYNIFVLVELRFVLTKRANALVRRGFQVVFLSFIAK